VAVRGLASGCTGILESCVVYRAAQFARAVRRVKLTISCKWSRTQKKAPGCFELPGAEDRTSPEVDCPEEE
jgi:hypothetical protein